MDVLCVGDAVIDIFLSLYEEDQALYLNENKELCIKHGEKIQVEKAKTLLGGNACNVSVGLSRLKFNLSICAEIGDDEFSEKIIKGLLKEGINTNFIKQSKDKDSSFSIGINFKGERTLFVEHVKRKHDFFFPQDFPKLIYLTSLGEQWIDVYKKTLEYVKSKKVKLAFNPGSLQLLNGQDMVLEVFKTTDIVFLNKEEAARLTGKVQSSKFKVQNEGNQEIIKELLKQLKTIGSKIVVITDGRNGSYSMDENGKMYYLGEFPGDPIERTGAGDAYTSGFLAAILTQKSIDEAMRWGTVNAGSVVQKIGAQTGLLNRQEILSILGSHLEFKAREI